MTITSRHNPVIKAIRSLRDRRERDAAGLFTIEGIGALGWAVELGIEIERAVVCPELCGSAFGRQLLCRLQHDHVPLVYVSAECFSLLTDDRSHGMLAILRQRSLRLNEMSVRRPAVLLALDAIQYPANLGTILRTADATGCAGVILLDRMTDPFAPAAVRASRGAVLSQRLVRATLDELADWKRAAGVPIIGASPAGAVDFCDLAYPDTCVIMMGNERHGLSREHLRMCDELVRIPMLGKCDSLNVAVATSIILYEALRSGRLARL